MVLYSTFPHTLRVLKGQRALPNILKMLPNSEVIERNIKGEKRQGQFWMKGLEVLTCFTQSPVCSLAQSCILTAMMTDTFSNWKRVALVSFKKKQWRVVKSKPFDCQHGHHSYHLKWIPTQGVASSQSYTAGCRGNGLLKWLSIWIYKTALIVWTAGPAVLLSATRRLIAHFKVSDYCILEPKFRFTSL